MSLKLNDTFAKGFVSADELSAIAPMANLAFSVRKSGKGQGSDFLGWVDLPVAYDKEEFARIQNAAERIKKSSDLLIVIGIGGSYLGARAAIEFVKSPRFHNLKKDTPDI